MAASEERAARRALNRFGLGARIGEVRQGAGTDPRGWLKSQLRPEAAALPSRTDVPEPAEIGRVLSAQYRANRSTDEEERATARSDFRELLGREAGIAMSARVTSDTPFVERLVAFWSNHLCISGAAAPPVAGLAGDYERSVVRAHLFGRFEEMVLASARHPAMLVYLDNARSIGPESRAGRFTARRGEGRGLNENYARELLELHTLGVDGGYVQDDVEAAARILTGWSVDLGFAGPGGQAMGARRRGREAPSGAPAFLFREEAHEPGTKEVLARRYGPGGLDEGEALIRDLCRHPSTATFLATKLVRHFVADDPPPNAVERIAGVYRDTGGDLLAVSRALVDLEEAWEPEALKFRTPQDWVVAALRAFHAREVPPPLLGVIRELRHPLWAPPSPKGFDDTARVWADPDSLMNRAELARTLAERVAEGPAEPERLLEVMEGDGGGALATMLRDRTIAAEERFALALGGPAFQWR